MTYIVLTFPVISCSPLYLPEFPRIVPCNSPLSPLYLPVVSLISLYFPDSLYVCLLTNPNVYITDPPLTHISSR